MDAILATILHAIAIAAATALTAFLVGLARRNGLSIDQAKEDALHDAAQKGIEYAEEEAVRYFKENGSKLTSAAKRKLALEFVARKIPGVDSVAAYDAVHAEHPSGVVYDPTKSVPR